MTPAFPIVLMAVYRRLGLVEAPPPLLTLQVCYNQSLPAPLSLPFHRTGRLSYILLQEWEIAEEKARDRNDSALPCPICKEHFQHDDQVSALASLQPHTHYPISLRVLCDDGDNDAYLLQVILSCSHVFHEACIRSFERFSGCKACPLCRCRDYQKKRTWAGKELFRQRSVLLLQRVLRCARARRMLRHLQDTVVPKDAHKRQEFWAKRLGKLTDSLLMQVLSARFYLAQAN